MDCKVKLSVFLLMQVLMASICEGDERDHIAHHRVRRFIFSSGSKVAFDVQLMLPIPMIGGISVDAIIDIPLSINMNNDTFIWTPVQLPYLEIPVGQKAQLEVQVPAYQPPHQETYVPPDHYGPKPPPAPPTKPIYTEYPNPQQVYEYHAQYQTPKVTTYTFPQNGGGGGGSYGIRADDSKMHPILAMAPNINRPQQMFHSLKTNINVRNHQASQQNHQAPIREQVHNQFPLPVPITLNKFKAKEAVGMVSESVNSIGLEDKGPEVNDNDFARRMALFHHYHLAKRSVAAVATNHRKDLFTAVETILASAIGLDGKRCVQRAVCESAALPLLIESPVHEVLEHILRVSRSYDEDGILHEYLDAELAGRNGTECATHYGRCPFSIFYQMDL